MKDYIFSDMLFDYIDCDFGEFNVEKEDFTRCCGSIEIKKTTITTDDEKEKYHKPFGKYVTISSDKFLSLNNENINALVHALSNEIKLLITDASCKYDSILIAGIGNSKITADSLGYETVDRISCFDISERNVYKIIPEVSSFTGIQTATHIKAISKAVSADIVIVVDSLISRYESRLYSTIQLSNSGITAGSGIGKKSITINEENIGVPIISVGVPTLVSASTLICEALRLSDIFTVSEKLKKILDKEKKCFVTTGDSDISVKITANILADGINEAIKGI